jgi:23S rRNA (cytosine1962-C5)-methyltransferase
MHKIILKPGKAKPFWNKEPLVFSGAIAKIEGDPQAGELVGLYDDAQYCIGTGVFNPHSQYRVRLLAFTQEKLEQDLDSIVTARLQQAQEKRKALKLPSADNTAYRLLNSEGDGLSGLTVDVFGDSAVVSSTAYWVELYRERLQSLLKKVLGIGNIVWRQQSKALTQDGWTERDTVAPASQRVNIQENGLKYVVDLGQGQKTGFYCDQRENRKALRTVVKNKKVLDCFCYTGGFALNAAWAGAHEVLGVDSSELAITLAKENAALNKLKNVSFDIQDVDQALKAAHGFDCIVLDPPKLAPTQKSLMRAKHYYLKLNTLALQALPEGGHLLTFSCSDAVDAKLFLSTVRMAAARAKKKIRVLQTLKAGDDHPFLERSLYGQYLKGLLIEVGGSE